MFSAGGVRSQEPNEAGKLLAHPVPAAFEPEAFVLEAAGKDLGTHLAWHGAPGTAVCQLTAGKVSKYLL